MKEGIWQRVRGCVITEIEHYRTVFALISFSVPFHGHSYCLYTLVLKPKNTNGVFPLVSYPDKIIK